MIYKEESSWKKIMERYNAPSKIDDKQRKKTITDCYRRVHVCEECDSVYEYATRGNGVQGMVVFKYSQLFKRGFEVKTCPNCQDSTIPVEWY